MAVLRALTGSDDPSLTGGIDPLALIGAPPEHRDHRDRPSGEHLTPDIAPTARIEAYVTVDAGVAVPTRIGERTWLMKKVHVGHDAIVGDDCEVAPLTSIGGHARIGDRVKIGQGAVFRPFVTVGDGARIGAGAVVVKDVPAGEVWAGNPARPIRRAVSGEQLTTAEIDGWEEWWAAAQRPRPVQI